MMPDEPDPEPDVVISEPITSGPLHGRRVISTRIECSPEAAAAFAATGPLYLAPFKAQVPDMPYSQFMAEVIGHTTVRWDG
jgi:hypothetical protein